MLGTVLKHWSQGTKPQYKWSEIDPEAFKVTKFQTELTVMFLLTLDTEVFLSPYALGI